MAWWAPTIGYALALLVALLALPDQDTYQWAAFSLRSLLVLGGLAWAIRTYASMPDGAMRGALGSRMRDFAVVAALLVATLAFDGAVFAFSGRISRMGQDTLLRYVCERNLFEDALVVYCCVVTIRDCSSVLALRFKEPPAESPVVDEVRLSLFAERYHLTPTERAVLALVVEGLKVSAIAGTMYISEGTVKTHISHIYRKVGCSGRTELLQEFWKIG